MERIEEIKKKASILKEGSLTYWETSDINILLTALAEKEKRIDNLEHKVSHAEQRAERAEARVRELEDDDDIPIYNQSMQVIEELKRQLTAAREGLEEIKGIHSFTGEDAVLMSNIAVQTLERMEG